ncbi:unnamed protein product [Amoebophrya sp. A25]|nr:unnamed protein product [Amoebophrya sp. A25]|eukprot:GSA25T00008951001.1
MARPSLRSGCQIKFIEFLRKFTSFRLLESSFLNRSTRVRGYPHVEVIT